MTGVQTCALPISGQVASLIYQGTSFHLVVTGTNPLTLPFLTGLSSTATIYDSTGGTPYQIGFRQLPPNVQNANYTTVLADDGKFLYHSDGTAYSYTVNNSLAYNVGATISVVNDSSAAVNITISLSTGTLRWAPSGGTGPRTLAQYGKATIQKVASSVWYITGIGLT